MDFNFNILAGVDLLAPKSKKAKDTKVAKDAKPSAKPAVPPCPRKPAPIPIARGIIIREQFCRACGTTHSFVDGDFLILDHGRKDSLRTWERVDKPHMDFFAHLPKEFYSAPVESVNECYECLMLGVAGAQAQPEFVHHLPWQGQLSLQFDAEQPPSMPSTPSPTIPSALLAQLRLDLASGETNF